MWDCWMESNARDCYIMLLCVGTSLIASLKEPLENQLVDSGATLDAMAYRKPPFLRRESNSGSPLCSPKPYRLSYPVCALLQYLQQLQTLDAWLSHSRTGWQKASNYHCIVGSSGCSSVRTGEQRFTGVIRVHAQQLCL
jgi:hypothetical protein